MLCLLCWLLSDWHVVRAQLIFVDELKSKSESKDIVENSIDYPDSPGAHWLELQERGRLRRQRTIWCGGSHL